MSAIAEVAAARRNAMAMYETMALVREFERQAYRAYERGHIAGTVHVSIGQEAVAVGVIAALRASDQVLSHHRGHGHALAKGVDPRHLMAELFGRSSGVSGGKGGSMHATAVEVGFLGTLAVVGSSLPLAVGVGLAAVQHGEDHVCAVFFGDGAVNQGVLYESMNLAALWNLPVLFVCEDNAFAITTAATAATAGPGIVARASSFGLATERVDGQDAMAVQAATARLTEEVRRGHPALLHCETYRFLGHSRGDPPHGVYRSREDVESWEHRDPLDLLATTAGLPEHETSALVEVAAERIRAAVAHASNASRPDEADLHSEVWG